MIVFSVGIGIGSYGCTKLLKGVISAKYVPLSAFALSAFITDLYFVSVNLSPPPDVLITVRDFLSSPRNLRLLFDLVGISICGGLYTVPLYAILQNDSDPTKRSRIIAANNLLNALFMVFGAVVATAMLALDYTIPEVFLLLAIVNCVIALYLMRLIPSRS